MDVQSPITKMVVLSDRKVGFQSRIGVGGCIIRDNKLFIKGEYAA